MTDIKETIQGLYALKTYFASTAIAQHGPVRESLIAMQKVLGSAVTLLKEQEAVEPNVSSTEQRCGNCNKVIEMDGWIACPWCGKPIAWNEWWNKNGGRAVKRE